MTNMILQFAKIPPPIGGVTIHVKRLVDSLQKESDIKVNVLDYSKEKNPFKILNMIFSSKIIHIHVSNKKIRVLFLSLFKICFKKVIITYHGKYDFKNTMDIFSLKYCDAAIVLNEYSYKSAKKKISTQKIFQIGAFIPPDISKINPLQTILKEKVDELKRNFKIILCTNASNYIIDPSGSEVYMGSELLNFFIQNNNLALIFSDPSNNYTKHFEQVNIEIPRNVLIINQPHDFINIIKSSNGLIRATTMDGDSLSIKESLYYGIPVFATDVVDRPKGVILFSKISELNDKIELIKKRAEIIPPENNFISILNLYKTILKK